MDRAASLLVLGNSDRLTGDSGLLRGFTQEEDAAAVLGRYLGRLAALDAVDEGRQLGGIGRGVARLEVWPGVVAARGVAARALDRGRRHVARAQHALGAEHLDALVVAVDRA